MASAFGVRSCVVSAAGPDVELGSVFQGHELHLVPSGSTLTFEHTYTFWGNKRKLRVTAQPNVTLTLVHVPWRCRLAKVVLLGPLMPEDLDPAAFTHHNLPLWLRVLGLRQRVGLMAQGLQRGLDAGGRVVALQQPSPQLQEALGPRTGGGGWLLPPVLPASQPHGAPARARPVCTHFTLHRRSCVPR